MKNIEDIFKAQEDLIDAYRTFTLMPAYPLSLEDKDDRAYLKGLVGDTYEEIMETTDTFDELVNITLVTPEKNPVIIFGKLEQLNEEAADVMHFVIEILIYLDIYPEDIDLWLSNYGKERNIDSMYFPGKVLETLFSFGRFHNTMNMYITGPSISNYFLKRPEIIVDKYISVGTFINETRVYNLDKQVLTLMRACFRLQKSLKSKYWRQSNEEVDPNIPKNWGLLMLIEVFCWLDLLNSNPENILAIYKRKNIININRIKEKY